MSSTNKHGIPRLKFNDNRERFDSRSDAEATLEAERVELSKKQIQRKLMKMCDGACYYCGFDLTFETLTIDHVKPLSRGGRDELDNMVPACHRCNSTKGNLSLMQFREIFKRVYGLDVFHGETRRNAKRFI